MRGNGASRPRADGGIKWRTNRRRSERPTSLPALLLAVAAWAALTAEPAQAQRGRRAAMELAASRGEMMAQTCFSCHGPKGGSIADAVPTIGGQGAGYLVSALIAFKEGKRPSTVMERIMTGFTDVEISEIAKYLTRQPFQRFEQITEPAKVQAGAVGYRNVCSECHLENGRASSMSDYPILAGQRLLYMQLEMQSIHKSTQRKVEEKFRQMLDKLPDDQIEAVLHFFAAQR